VEGIKDDLYFKIYHTEVKDGKKFVPKEELKKDLEGW
jgi:hypothetical protein